MAAFTAKRANLIILGIAVAICADMVSQCTEFFCGVIDLGRLCQKLTRLFQTATIARRHNKFSLIAYRYNAQAMRRLCTTKL